MEKRYGEMTFDKRSILGMGSYSTVFVGFLNEEKVAVKRIQLFRGDIMQREEEVIRQLKHPNVIKLLAVEEDDDFRYYAFELAAATLYDFCQGKYFGAMPSDCEGLLQMAKGLKYIHGEKFVHRDIKPSNILISMNEPVRLMISDFGLCKATTNTGTCSMGSGNKGTEGWMAPEMFDYSDADDDDSEQSEKRFGIASDTWALGCLFFYFLTRGIHPFGKTFWKIRINIIVEQTPVELEKTFQSSNNNMVEVCKLIRNMIEIDPKKRTLLEHVIEKLAQMQTVFNKTKNEERLFPSTLEEIKHPERSTARSKHRENDSTTGKGQGNEGSQQKTENDNAANHVEAENAEKSYSAESEEETPEPAEEGDENDRTEVEEEGKLPKVCCACCKRIPFLERDCENLNKQAGSANSKIGHLNESAIRTNLDSNEARKPRSILSLYQLVKCYGEAKDETWTETDTYDNCKRIIKHLKKNNSESNFCLWYYEQAVNSLKNKAKYLENKTKKTNNQKEVKKFEKQKKMYEKKAGELEKTSPTKTTNQNSNVVQFKVVWKFGDEEEPKSVYFSRPSTSINRSELSQFSSQELLNALLEMTKEKEKLKEDQSAKSDNQKKKQNIPQYEIVKFYKKNQFKNYIPGPIENWDEYTKPNSPIFLLALYESIKHDENLLSFPPPGILTMDVPVKISWGKSLAPNPSTKVVDKSVDEIFTVLIEVGEIKSSANGITDAKLQLRRSLLCFKWLDQVISPVEASYGLIGNIYIDGNSSEAQKNTESENKTKSEFPGEGITFKTRYEVYK